jgi:hypothetical protein
MTVVNPKIVMPLPDLQPLRIVDEVRGEGVVDLRGIIILFE